MLRTCYLLLAYQYTAAAADLSDCVRPQPNQDCSQAQKLGIEKSPVCGAVQTTDQRQRHGCSVEPAPGLVVALPVRWLVVASREVGEKGLFRTVQGRVSSAHIAHGDSGRCQYRRLATGWQQGAQEERTIEFTRRLGRRGTGKGRTDPVLPYYAA